MKKHYYLFLLIFILPFCSFAQGIIKGHVFDIDNQTVVGAVVKIEGTKIGTTTNVNGTYKLDVPYNLGKRVVVVVSFTGFNSESTPVNITQGVEATQDFTITENALQIRDVIVSANKKEENLQNVPMSITVLSPKELRRTGANNFRDYASSIPNISFGTQGGGGAFNDGRTSNQIALRGITGSNTTAMYLDETPLPSNIDPRLVDIARIEVLRGPQGSLYGSSTMGGAVKVITNQPNVNQKESSISTSVSSVKEGKLDNNLNAIFNLPFADNKAALRVVGFYDYQSGVYDRVANKGVNILNSGTLKSQIDGTPRNIETDNRADYAPTDKENVDNKTSYGAQISVTYNPSKNFSITPKVIYQGLNGTGYDFADINTKNFKQYRSSSVNENFSDNWGHYSVAGKYNLENGKIISSTSFTSRKYKEQEDEGQFLSTVILNHPDSTKDFWAGVINRDGKFDKFVQELRYQSEYKGNFNFLAGLYYGNETLVENGLSVKKGFIKYLGGPDELDAYWFKMNNTQKVSELALFGELYYDVNPDLRLTAGIRYFNATNKRTYAASGAPYDFDETSFTQDTTNSGFNPKFNITYKINKTSLFYATVSKGYRLGGLNAPLPALWCKDALKELGGQPPKSYDADFLWNYEAGIKTTLADGRVIANAAVFYNDWKNLQQRRFFPDCGLGFVSNVGSASSKGLEFDAKVKVVKGLDWGVSLGLLDAKIKSTGAGLDAKVGDRILFTPKITAATNLQYTKELSNGKQFYIRTDVQHVGERYSSFAWKTDPARVLAAYTLVNARIGYVMSHYEASIFVQNLTGEQANFGDVTSLAAETPGRPRYMTNRPRTIGVQLRAYF